MFSRLQIDAIMLGEQDTKLGAVETWQDAKACADLFSRERARIDGVLVCLPNLGDEKGVADVLRLSGLRVPVLVQACPDDINQFNVQRRRDAFCGKISVCNNLRQYGMAYSLTEQHTLGLTSAEFARELTDFLGVCRVLRGLTRARIGAIGARPNAFNTTRYSEKLLEQSGISVSTLDLSELLDGARRLDDRDERVRQKLADISGYAPAPGVQLASGKPSALVDWNNNYGNDPNKCVFFHCGNWAKAFLPDATIATAPILGTTLGEHNTYGAMAGRTSEGPVTFGRVSTDEQHGRIRAYVSEGRLTDDPLETFGTRAVVEVPELQKLMHFICRNGFEHHAAMNASHSAGILTEAMHTYLGWEVHRHS